MSRIMHDLKQSSHHQSSINQHSLSKPSFKGYQNHHVPNSTKGMNNKRGSSLAMGLILILVPSLLVGGVLTYQSYSQQQEAASKTTKVTLPESTTQSNVEPEIADADIASMDAVPEEVDALFAVRPAPASQPLKALPRQEMYAQIDSGANSANTAGGSAVIVASADNNTQMAASSESSPVQPTVQSSASDETRDQPSNSDLQSDSDLLQGLDLSELPPDLALKLESIMGDQQSTPEPMDSRPAGQRGSQVIELETHTNSLSGVLPKLDLQTHMYSSSETKRWVKVNGQEVAQGDWIGQDIQLLEIKPQSVIIEFNQQKIEIPALYEWKG
ncbi:general secretion pathway protein GspB [Vibrio sp. 10N.261.46.E12]|uniref:general secretion pathway protein GspB n=1 Tax=unclassified Vibrio TaxID=2614977 RepID=UPI0009763A17|nr:MULTISPECIES: general secretion pathway protein GspB [unclassified Vibrio]OMO35570.1 general secretion pathway protein GspA [Vibrio sp. 10N.261.45.E1]PMJ23492.1 general secretion pathway protein GspA [Vibrio sp. 10N.286.45.B6]PML87452.1 general secretion pathway protein GspA [Vibrio sp. 10N.261.49.E11]PMM73830.1 general secretion pathway protein GspA [Vibrio sp. 10N.261.46.F12]PMM87227.1 general secretion pathway protein GspA [Vibrio sp. 10N.261.46.E8]